jgi:hypothetical protein
MILDPISVTLKQRSSGERPFKIYPIIDRF